MLRYGLSGYAAFLALLPLALTLFACGPTRDEDWNSYYYGASQVNRYDHDDHHGMDNDDSYILPNGTWGDDQSLQGHNWK